MSDFIRWREEWIHQIPSVDEQHRVLAGLVNQIADVVRQGQQSSNMQSDPTPSAAPTPIGSPERCKPVTATEADRRICQLAEEIIVQARHHFRDEEALMLRARYRRYEMHRREHCMLLAELVSLARGHQEGSERIDVAALTALKHWLLTHIAGSGREFADYYHAAGAVFARAAEDDEADGEEKDGGRTSHPIRRSPDRSAGITASGRQSHRG
jgi:hemerythrin